MGEALKGKTGLGLIGGLIVLLAAVAFVISQSLDRSRDRVLDNYEERTEALAGFAAVAIEELPAAERDADSVVAEISPYVKSASTVEGARTEVVSAEGTVLASTEDVPRGAPALAGDITPAMLGSSGTFGEESGASRYSTAPIGDTGLWFVRSAPDSSIFASQAGNRRLTWGLFIGFALAFVGLLIALILALERRRLSELRHARTHDSVTGLPAGAPFEERIRDSLASPSCAQVAVLSLGFDGYRRVKDSLGREAADELMVQLSERLGSEMRMGDLLAQAGGERFFGLCHVADENEVAAITARILAVAGREIPVGDRKVSLTMRIGIAMGEPGDDAATLVRHADTALSEAWTHRRSIEVYGHALGSKAMARLELESSLRDAIANDELVLHYQPVVSLDTGEVAACEALVRWDHPERGLLGPDNFVPLAEEMGLIGELGETVLRMACEQGARWADAGTPVDINVNISARQLEDSLPMSVALALDESGMEAERLCLELTETAIAEDEERAAKTIRALRRLRTKVAIDDFGTGYSSWSRLAGNLPVTCLKIDRSFTAAINRHLDATVLASIIQLGAALDIEVVAEGVETAAQEAALRSMRCPRAQGFHFAGPAPPEEVVLEPAPAVAAIPSAPV